MIEILLTILGLVFLFSPAFLAVTAIFFAAEADDEIPPKVARSYGVKPKDVVLINSKNWTGR